MKKNSGIELWKKALNLIPGGTQLLSKKVELHLPEQWPSYFQKAKGIEVWDLDGNVYQDFSLMGVGSCILGYADDDVNQAVKKVIDQGNMNTLNSSEEVELAEVLLKLHPWAQMVRYARTGGEIVAIAIRTARAYSKKDKVAFCGYHGWHDWYLASNLADDKSLDGHLLPGLKPVGVPRGLLKTALPFEYNKIEQLEKILEEQEVGVIILEPIRHQEPKDSFLSEVRELANSHQCVLIFDEISCGFRLTIGGAHLTYDVNPDMAIFAKAMSNGFPMAAVLGKRSIMEAMNDSFISSTYWTERIGPTAALATIRKMQEQNVPDHIHRIGALIGEGWKQLAQKHGLNVDILGPNALITLVFKDDKNRNVITLFTQEMLKLGYLANPTVYVCYSHTERAVSDYLLAIDRVFGIIKGALNTNTVDARLEGPVSFAGFKRLT